jgi:hypothetical protein
MSARAKTRRLDRLQLHQIKMTIQMKQMTLTCPAYNFVTPKCGGLIQVLHERIVSPQSHPVDHAPFVFALIILRVLKYICSVVGKRVATGSFLRPAIYAR